MSWGVDALKALKKIITLEERVTRMTDDVKALTGIMRDMDKRLTRLEAKIEVYESIAKRSGPRQIE